MPNISILIPVRNEKGTIQKLCEKIDSALTLAHIDYEIIIVDDHSTDGTLVLAEKLQKRFPIRSYLKVGSRGKGYSLLEGAVHAKAPIVCMIDADLQYDPSYIPEMYAQMHESPHVGVVIAQRRDFKAGVVRKLSSRINAFMFGSLLFGLKLDIQSGLKLFRKDLVEHIEVKFVGPWSFDIPLLHAARESGYGIKQVPITFEARDEGASKVRILSVGKEIATNAIRQRIAPKKIYPIRPLKEGSMVGAGIAHSRKRFVTHTTLGHHNSAIKTLHGWQRNFLIGIVGLLGAGLIINPVSTIVVAFALLNAMYFFDVFFNLYMTMKTLKSSNEYTSTTQELEKVSDSDLPVYTVLCPLYKEANIIPQFVQAMSKLEWPKNKLDVMLLLEEDDVATIQAAEDSNLPSFIRIVVVPHSMPKTKPKATNYGLSFAKGEYVVIYDAEDIPDPYQLKKAYLAFQKAPNTTVCLQAKLNYYNPHQNTLTRLFTAEYSLWFDLILPGLQSIEAPLPLGGTSNHFRKEMLIELEGWDSFNVTEDCDLGIRLAKYGYQTAIIDSVTMEEANSNFKNWINQRSRWIKGYMQSYLVHMRFPRTFISHNTKDFFLFQLVVGGKILALFINPIMWLMTILYFLSRAQFGFYIEQLFPGPILYIGMFSLVLGNFVYLYYYMIACAKREHYSLVKYVYIVPFYWLAMSYAGYKALSELFYKPHFWQKTVHGLHLAQKPKPVQNKPDPKKPAISLSSGIFLVASIASASVLNFIFNAYLGRQLPFEEFALVSLIGGIVGISTIISGALSTTVSSHSGFLVGRYGLDTARAFWQQVRSSQFVIGLVSIIFWLMCVPFMKMYFNLDSMMPLILLSPVLLIHLVFATDRGFQNGTLHFEKSASLILSEPIFKLGLAWALVFFGFNSFIYISIPLSIVITSVLASMYYVYDSRTHKKLDSDSGVLVFPSRFFILAFLSGFSVIFLTTVDVLFAKHYLTAELAGQYALLMLAGKIVFFIGSFVTPFIIPLVSKNEGEGKDSHRILYYTSFITLALVAFATGAFGVFGSTTIPFLFGSRALVITPYIFLVCLSLSAFTISKVFVDYYLAKKVFTPTILGGVLCIVEVILIVFFHATLADFVRVMSSVWLLHLVLMLLIHFQITRVILFERLVKGKYRDLRWHTKSDADMPSILIFNWRDTKHKWAGGAEVFIQEISKRWVDKGYTVTQFSGNDGKNPSHGYVDGVEVYRHGSFYTVYIWAFVYYILKFRGRYSVIIDCENGIPFFTPLYASEKTFLLIHHVHQEVFRKSLPWPLAQIALFLEATVMPYVYRKDQVVTVSPSSQHEIVRHNLTKFNPEIIYNGVDLNEFKPGKKEKSPLIIYLGRLQYYKSLHVFIKAAKKVLESYPTATFIIAGEGEEKKKLQKYARKLGIGDTIKFLGRVTHEERISLFQRAWLFVNPSFMEGWGITTIEANACGTPAIASDVPGLKDSIIHNQTGILVPYGNADLFAERIMMLLKQSVLRKKLSNQSVEWAQGFTWDASAAKFLTLMNLS